LGLLKLYGIGLTQHTDTAAEYFRKAADLGLADAQTAYAVLLIQGQGMHKIKNKKNINGSIFQAYHKIF
jgi:TPR repeat protein